MKFIRHMLLILTAALCSLSACNHSGENKSIPAPGSGEFCYKMDSGAEYLQIKLAQGKIEGRIINTAEHEKLFQDFTGSSTTGKEANDATELRVAVSFADGVSDQSWLAWYEEGGLRLKYDPHAVEFTHYKSIPCDSIQRLVQNLQETILSYKSNGFRLPKGEPVCYRSVSPAHGTYLIEYFQLWNTDGKIKGRGAGYYAGDPVWDFDFHGTLAGTKLQATVNYRKTGEEQHSVIETWTLDPKSDRIYIRNFPKTVMGAREYVNVDNADFLNFVHSYFEKKDLVR